jgi:CHC2 zinc finger
MHNTTFRDVVDRSQLPSARDFYQREGFKFFRPNSKGWVMCQGSPPCHKSRSAKSFSVNIEHGGFQCFGCGAKGDLFGYVMLRDRCDFKTACKSLGCWRNVSADERTAITQRRQEAEWQRCREIERSESERRERLKLRDELLTTTRIYYRLVTLLDQVGPTGTIAESCWSALPPTFDCLRLEESAYCKASRLEDPYA